MTDYYIIPDICNGIADRAEDIMADRDAHFSKLQDALAEAMSACGSGRQVKGGGTSVMGEFTRFTDIGETLYTDKLEPTHRDVCGHIDSSISAFRDVINAHVSGDIETAIRSESAENNHVELPIPEVRNSDGTVIFEGGTVGTAPAHGPGVRGRGDAQESPAQSPFANHPGYEDSTP